MQKLFNYAVMILGCSFLAHLAWNMLYPKLHHTVSIPVKKLDRAARDLITRQEKANFTLVKSLKNTVDDRGNISADVHALHEIYHIRKLHS